MRKHKKKILLGLILILVLLTGGFLLYASFFYRADDKANTVFQTGVKDQSIEVDHDLTIFGGRNKNEIGFIFYPGT